MAELTWPRGGHLLGLAGRLGDWAAGLPHPGAQQLVFLQGLHAKQDEAVPAVGT